MSYTPDNLPDAPWIRDAETNGLPDGDTPICPMCGSECDTMYTGPDGEVLGCEHCVFADEPDDRFYPQTEKPDY